MNADPWEGNLARTERVARLRALHAPASIFAKNSDFLAALRRAERGDPADLDHAGRLFGRLPELSRRRLLRAYNLSADSAVPITGPRK